MKTFFALAIIAMTSLFTPAADAATEKTAYFAGGCFWCMEASFESLKGVSESISGYMNIDDAREKTEVVQVHYDPAVVTYDKLLEIFWLNIDPDDAGGQMYDRGQKYRTAIFYSTDEEKDKAVASKAATEKELGRTLAPLIVKAASFHEAEAGHQNYYKTNEGAYTRYKYGSGRPSKLKEVWGDKATH